ncbi:hypothetical protein [Pedobacter sp. GR22-6]|uniref:hypothetical protein n=1 Tax=Pedobacter sp. GR22-6 TaxID=3127957 RepID=UPI00307DB2A4
MKETIKNLLEKSGKRTDVSNETKKFNRKFDENFGKDKLELINTALGGQENKRLIFEKLSK